MARPRALVTGASSGIGAAYAQRLAADGYDLVVVARRRDRLLRLAQLLRDSHATDVAVEVVDLSSPSDLDRLVAAVPGFELDLLVNNAGFGAYAPFVRAAAQLVRGQGTRRDACGLRWASASAQGADRTGPHQTFAPYR